MTSAPVEYVAANKPLASCALPERGPLLYPKGVGRGGTANHAATPRSVSASFANWTSAAPRLAVCYSQSIGPTVETTSLVVTNALSECVAADEPLTSCALPERGPLPYPRGAGSGEMVKHAAAQRSVSASSKIWASVASRRTVCYSQSLELQALTSVPTRFIEQHPAVGHSQSPTEQRFIEQHPAVGHSESFMGQHLSAWNSLLDIEGRRAASWSEPSSIIGDAAPGELAPPELRQAAPIALARKHTHRPTNRCAKPVQIYISAFC